MRAHIGGRSVGVRRWTAVTLAASGLVAAGLLNASSAVAVPPTPTYTLDVYAGSGSVGATTPQAATLADMRGPRGMATDAAGNLYVADRGNNVVDKIDTNGNLTIVAGTGTSGAAVEGPATASPLYSPYGVAVDPQGNFFIADYYNHRVEKVDPSGQLTFFAVGLVNIDPIAVATDASGNVYIADENAEQVFKADASGNTTLFAGSGGYNQTVNGPATAVDLYDPAGLVVDPMGNVYIAVTYGGAYGGSGIVAKVDTSGMLTVVVGNGQYGSLVAGPALSSPARYPTSVALDPAGNLLFTDEYDYRIGRLVGTSLDVIAGNGTDGGPSFAVTPGPALNSALDSPYGIAVDRTTGAVYVSNTADVPQVVRLTPSATVPAAPTNLHATVLNDLTTLSFDAPWSGGSPITGYEYSTDGGATWRPLTTAGSSAVTATLSGVTPGQYSFLVRAVNAIGSSDPSNAASATIAATLAKTGSDPTAQLCTAGSLLSAGALLFTLGLGRRRTTLARSGEMQQ